MNFNELYKKIAEIDSRPLEECGEPMGMSAPHSAPATPPSMSVNLNAQGMSGIEDLLKLITKVNPTEPAAPTAAPALSPSPQGPMGRNPADDMKSFISKISPDSMNKPKQLPAPEEEGFQDATTSPDPEYKDIDAVTGSGNDLLKSKKMYPKAQDGDNPMAVEAEELLARLKEKYSQELASFKAI